VEFTLGRHPQVDCREANLREAVAHLNELGKRRSFVLDPEEAFLIWHLVDELEVLAVESTMVEVVRKGSSGC
jgi:hypothetical protein